VRQWRLALCTGAFAVVVLRGVAAPTLSAQEREVTEAEIDTAPVTLDGQVLFRVRGASSLPAEKRAADISRRIEAAAADPSIDASALRVADSEGIAWIVAAKQPLLAVTEADARLEQLARDELALVNLTRIRQAVHDYRQARSPDALKRSLRDTAGATLAFLASLGIVFLLARWLHRIVNRRLDWLARQVEAPAGASDIRTIALPRAERIAAALHQAVRLVAGLLALALLFEFLRYTLGRFPGTRHLSNGLLGLVLGPISTMWQSFVSQLPNLAFLAVLLVVFRVVLRLLRAVFDALQRDAVHVHGFEAEWAQPTYKIVRFALIAFGLVVAYPYLPGSESAAFKGVSLFVGVLLSLGSSSAIANLVAGYSLIYRRAFKVGDRVKIGDVIGEVTESRIQVTRLRSLKNEEVVIPNSVILGGEVVNYSALARSHGLILHTQVGIGYETPWRQVEAMLLEAAARTPNIVRTRPPFVLQKALGDFAVTYELNVYCDDAAAAVHIYTNLHRQILDVFNEYGVQIMTPAYEGDPEQPKVVPPAHWYAAPAVMPDRGVAAVVGDPSAGGSTLPR
jgi:small-conductance mechanosensitive channel